MTDTDKKTLRKRIRKLSDELSGEYIKTAGRGIAEKVVNSAEFSACKSLFVYVSTAREPDTYYIIEKAWQAGKRVFVPRCLPDNQMQAVRLDGFSELRAGMMNIPEPVGHETAEPEELDLIIVPCVSASADGKRLGHGAGYYDRFLERTNAEKICLCFGKLLCEDIPTDSRDVFMDKVISE